MPKKTLYPTKVSQSAPNSNFRAFNNLSNIKNNKDTYAKTNQIASKNSSNHKRPATIAAAAFNFKVPVGSTINSITCEYAAAIEGNISISSPVVDCTVVGTDSKKGRALTKTMTKTSIVWKGNRHVSNINAAAFGVKIAFPSNAKNGTGYVKIQYVRLIIDYTPPNIRISAKKLTGKYVGDNFQLEVAASNVNKTSYDTNVNIQLPAGVSYVGKSSGEGSINSSGSKLIWKPGLSKKVLTRKIVLKLSASTSGTKNISLSESLTGHAASTSFSVSNRPTNQQDSGEDDDTGIGSNGGTTDSNLNILTVDINEEFELDLNFEGYGGEYVQLYGYKVDDVNGELHLNDISSDIKIYARSMGVYSWRIITYFQPQTVPGGFQGNVPFNFPMDGTVQNRFRIESPGTYSILVYGDSLLKRFNIHVRPNSEELSDPSFTIFKLGQEEINRLGHGYNYTVSSLIKLITPESFIRDWRKNYRIGVFNNINPNIDTSNTIIESEEIYDSENNSTDEVSVEEIESEIVDDTDYENLSDLEIFRYAEYWSDILLKNEEWIDLSVEFPYNEEYPVYIILTGDYPESVNCTENVLHFTEPCVIESTVYHGREPNGNFPTPIFNTIINEDLSEIVLKLYEQSNSFVTYQLPLDEGFSVSDTFAITGIEVACDIEYTDQCVLSAKLIDQDKNSSSRSIILNDIDENEDSVGTFVLGGRYDRWGFKSSELQNLEKWQIEFALNNIFENSNNEAIVKFKNIQLIIYTQIVKSNFYKVFVEDENVRHLGMFVKKVIVPEGLKTETKYLNIDGSDINDAYRMNVDKKEIEIEFSIRGCNLEETTNMLRQLAKLFTNKRDDLNRPIPKRIEFAHYPDVYFEYILQEPFDSDPAITDYDSKLKLTVPAGTAFAKKDTVSNVSGVNQGIAKVNPIIKFIPTGDVVEISETINNQYFKISESDWSSENTVEIDCNTRKITILDYVDDETGMPIKKDISESGDLNNDWFVLHEDYSFEANNAIIQTVSFKERW